MYNSNYIENILKNSLFLYDLCKDVINVSSNLQFLLGTKFLVRKIYNVEVLKIIIYFFHKLKYDKFSSMYYKQKRKNLKKKNFFYVYFYIKFHILLKVF